MGQEGMTLEEYRYLKKGYSYQKEMGLDASKIGYKIGEGNMIGDVQMVTMIKENGNTPQGLLFIIPDETGKNTLICLPNNNAETRVKELHQSDQDQIISHLVKRKYQNALEQLLFFTIENVGSHSTKTKDSKNKDHIVSNAINQDTSCLLYTSPSPRD